MSTTAIRTTKVQAMRPPDPELSEKTTGPGYLARAVSLHLAGKREEALAQLQRAIAANQASAEIYRAMAHIQFEMGDFKEAGKTYRILTQVKPQYAMGWFNLAVCFERQGAWDDASESFHKASTLDPKHLDAHLGLGVCHLRLEDPKSALFSFERCLEIAPDHEDALFGKAAALQSLGHSDDASRIYQTILEHDSESEESLSNLILIGMSKEDFDMVREYAERLLELQRRPGRLGVRRRRTRTHRQILHPAGFRRPAALRGMVQPGAVPPEIRPLAAGHRGVRRGHQAAHPVL